MGDRLASVLRDAIDFPAFLKLARLAGGMSRLELASKAGTSCSHLSMLERGKRAPGPRTMKGLAAALDLRGGHYELFLRLAAEAQVATVSEPKGQQGGRASRAYLPRMTAEEQAFLDPILQRIQEATRSNAYMNPGDHAPGRREAVPVDM